MEDLLFFIYSPYLYSIIFRKSREVVICVYLRPHLNKQKAGLLFYNFGNPTFLRQAQDSWLCAPRLLGVCPFDYLFLIKFVKMLLKLKNRNKLRTPLEIPKRLNLYIVEIYSSFHVFDFF